MEIAHITAALITAATYDKMAYAGLCPVSRGGFPLSSFRKTRVKKDYWI